MSEGKYNVVFKGEILSGMSPEVAKQNFSDTFNITGMKLDAFFSGKPAVLKKNVDKGEGQKFRGQLKRLGLLSSLNPLGAPETPVQEAHAGGETPTATEGSSSSSQADAVWSLAPVGSDMNQVKDNRAPVSVDISQITVAPVGADILVEKKKQEVLDVDTSKLSIS
ncbi:MAG: hypothetical protein KUG76_03000 [Gammaproteobacteria bacterium]|nr:hypothetical protein [Gammaproteobacteria bacterium]